MRVEAQPAFVLHARAWRETSVIVELLTRDHGRVGVVARGLTGPKRHPLRAALQPLQSLRVDYLPRGELARLLQAEAVDVAPVLAGDRLLAAFYVNELTLRLSPRNDAAPALHALYARVRGELGAAPNLAWALRRFERDLLEAIGLGLPWAQLEEGEGVDPARRYRLDPEMGPLPDPRRGGGTVSGAALLALAADVEPEAAAMPELRRALRGVLEAALGGGTLKSWGLLDDLAQVRPRAADQD
jgi:DNA repair protein RecO (recombination protein O)